MSIKKTYSRSERKTVAGGREFAIQQNKLSCIVYLKIVFENLDGPDNSPEEHAIMSKVLQEPGHRESTSSDQRPFFRRTARGNFL